MTYWFDPMVGGGSSGGIIGGVPNYAPAMSSAQINASMGWNPAAQAQTTNLYGPMGFGGQTAMYAGLGAAYGRQVAPSSPAAVAAQHPAAEPAPDPWAGSGFDPILYLHNNPDVAGATGGDPMKAYEHARSYGVQEGRPGTDMFNPGESWSPPQERINEGFDAFPSGSQPWFGNTDISGQSRTFNNPMNRVDWGQSFGDNSPALKDTLRSWGAQNPGRYDPELDRLSGEAWSYLNDPGNADLRTAYGHDIFKAAQHAQQYGKPEGRNIYGLPGGATAEAYMNANRDVFDAVGGDVNKAAQHWTQYGQFENRDPHGLSKSSVARYLEANPDVAKWAGGDPAKGLQHYQQYGQPEGREGFGLQGRDAIAQALSAQKSPYAGSILGPAANPSYFNPGTYAGDKNNYGLPAYPGGGGVPTPPGPMPNSQELLGYDPNPLKGWMNPNPGS